MQKKIGAAPTHVYPESDGEPMAESPKHQQVMIDCMDIMRSHFSGSLDVYIGGNMLLYYEEGDPRKSISPDVFMVRGLSKKELRTYKTWEQPPTLDFVLEVASPSPFERDFTVKKDIYAKVLRVQEYCIYDPYHEIDPAFIGFRLVGEVYQEIAFANERLLFERLGLELGERDGMLRLYDPIQGEWLLTSQERAAAADDRVEQETRARRAAETYAAEEARARRAAEAELAQLREALERLQGAE